MDLNAFLASLVAADLTATATVAVIVAGLVWGSIEFLDKWVKTSQANRTPPVPAEARGIPGNAKFIGAVVGSVVLPYAAYFLLTWRTDGAVDGNGLFLAGVTAFLGSQILHRVLEGSGQRTTNERNILEDRP